MTAQRVQRRIDELTRQAGDPGSWPLIVAMAVGGGLVLVVGCRLVLAYTVTARAGIGIAGVTLVLVVALACLAGLLWAAWRIRLDSTAPGRFVTALCVSLVAIGVCTEAFAGITALLWRHGALAVGPGVAPALWRTELYYLWHLVDSVPLLKIPDGVGWREPMRLSGPAGGAFLLAYKVLLIAPLLRLGIASYQWLLDGVHKREAKTDDLIRRKVLPDTWTRDEPPTPHWIVHIGYWLCLVALLAAPVVTGFLLLPLIYEPGAWLDMWAARWAAALALVWATIGTMGEGFKALVRRGTELAESVIWYLAAIGFVIVAAAAVNLSLLRTGIATTDVPVPAGEQVRAAIAVHAWNLADAVPGPNIPGILQWNLAYTFTDRWSTLLVLLSKLTVLGVILVPVALAVASFTHYVRQRTRTPGALDHAALFAELFASARLATDRATRDDFRSRHAAQTAMRSVLAKLDGLATLFGRGHVTERADAAAGALHRRAVHWDPFGREAMERRRLREAEERQFAEFREAACQALEATAARIRAAG